MTIAHDRLNIRAIMMHVEQGAWIAATDVN
jgi:hypothetical protein